MVETLALDKAQIYVDAAQLADTCQQQDIVFLGIFGSVARGEARPDSDLDLLVRFSKPKSLLAFIALEDQLSILFSRAVDLLTDDSLSPHIRDRVLHDLQVLYERK